MMRWQRAVWLAAVALMGCDLPEVSAESAPASVASTTLAARFAEVKLSAIESRAQSAGWKVLGSHQDGDGGVTQLDLELDDGSHYAYVSVVDLGGKGGALSAAKMGTSAALHVQVLDAGAAGQARADALLERLGATVSDDALSRDAVGDALGKLGYRIVSRDSEQQDGVVTHALEVEGKDESSLVVSLYDLGAASRDGRIAVDGHRFMSVFVCKDCNDRKVKALSQAWQNAKARVLLEKLANPS